MGHLTFVHTKCVVVLWHFAATYVSKSGHSSVNKPSVSMSHLSCHVLGRPVWSIWIFEQTIDEFWCSYPMYFLKKFAVSRAVTSSLCCYGMLAWSLVFMQYVPGWHLLTVAAWSTDWRTGCLCPKLVFQFLGSPELGGRVLCTAVHQFVSIGTQCELSFE